MDKDLTLKKKQLNEQIKNQNEELELIKKEYEKNIKEKYENKLAIEINNMKQLLNKELEENKMNLDKNYELKFKKKEKEKENIVSQMSNIIQKKSEDNSKINKSFCNTTHLGIKCERCFKEPIVGYRYKCSQCNNYNLCQECEEFNSQTGQHPHDFIKIRKEEEKNNNYIINNNQIINNLNNDNSNDKNEDNKIKFSNIFNSNIYDNKNNNNDNDDDEGFNILDDDLDGDENKKEYSYECLNLGDLNKEIYEGKDEAKIKITLKNNKNNTWPKENTKLVFDYCSNFIQNDIVLEPQKYNQTKDYIITINELSSYPPSEYKILLNFEINGENYGDKIEINLIIKENNN